MAVPQEKTPRESGEGGPWLASMGMLPSMSEWMTSTNCASLGSNLSSGGFPLNKGPAGSRPGKENRAGEARPTP